MQVSQEMIQHVAQNEPRLKKLDLRFNRRNKLYTGFADLCAALEQNTVVTALDIANADKALPLLVADAKALSKNTSIRILDISGNNLCVSGAQAFGKFTSLKKLNAIRCQISDKGAVFLAKNPSLTHLNLSHNKIGPEGVIALAASTSLRELDLSNNNVGDGIIAFAQNNTLTTLKLSTDTISLISLGALLQNNHLETLVLEGSQFAARWGDEVVDLILTNTNLANLRISYHRITDEGAARLATHPTIKHLELSGNQITKHGIDVLAANPRLHTLVVDNNRIHDVGANFMSNATIATVNLSRNNIRDAGAVALSNNPHIQHLDVSGCGIGDVGARAFLKNTLPRTLEFRGNDLSMDLKRELKNPAGMSATVAEHRETFFKRKNIDVEDSASLINGVRSWKRHDSVVGALALRQHPKVTLPNDIMGEIMKFALPKELATIGLRALTEFPQKKRKVNAAVAPNAPR